MRIAFAQRSELLPPLANLISARGDRHAGVGRSGQRRATFAEAGTTAAADSSYYDLASVAHERGAGGSGGSG